jgi:LuxR family maltose regulon positive regulatory protein
MASEGMARLVADARTGMAGIAEESPFRQTALILAGFADLVSGSPGTADALMAEAANLSEARRATPGLALALGERAHIALARGDLTAATRHVQLGLGFVRDAGMEAYAASAMLHATAARTALASGSAAEARLAIASVHRMRPHVSASLPIVALQMRFDIIRVNLVLREAAAARALLLEVDDILRQCPDLGVLVDEAIELRRAVGSMRASAAGPWTLTAAELRLLGYLPTHLSFREIAERLFVSPHTIKSQATAIYGKLGVSSRRGAIEQAVEAGLLDASVIRIPDMANGTSGPG